ncbi:hypothetical protein L0U85_00065 [Glycomyces sp. L485]|uniref:hypothetical protein n=1 Tax=Glycomyces sp. L485 TaxID=2909235 RepID=UPI001F4B68E1|nr:hypothetical protein [Glycomyces sp. L485]MCH7229268.1 hypothetical protein [Glycomyces sp. L485]
MIVKLVQDQPEIAANLIGLADGEEHGLRCSGAETRSCAVGSPGPVERRADGVVKLTFEGGFSRIVIVEVQNTWKQEKYYRLPGYMARAFEDYRLPVELLLIGGTDAVARRFRNGIDLGPGNRIAIRTLGPADFPSLTDPYNPPEPAIAILSAALGAADALHSPYEAELFASTLDEALGTIEPQRAADYTMYLLGLLKKDVGTLLETIMETKSQPYHSAYSDRLRKEGREEGREEGGVLEARKILLTLLDASPTPVESELREQVEQCSDLRQFEAWATEFATTGRLTMRDQ